MIFWDLTAATHSNPPFLRVDLSRKKFDLDGLINKQALNALTLEGGSLVFGKSLREFYPMRKRRKIPRELRLRRVRGPSVPSTSSESPCAWMTNDRK